METNPGNSVPDLNELWHLMLNQYGIIIGLIGLLCLCLTMVGRSQTRHASCRDLHKTRSSSDLWVEFIPRQQEGPDEWFSTENQKELYRDFSPN